MFEIIFILIMSIAPGYLISFFDNKLNDIERLCVSFGISFLILGTESFILHLLGLPLYFTLITFIPIFILILLRKPKISFKVSRKLMYFLLLSLLLRFVLQFFYQFPYNGDSYFHMVLAKSFTTEKWFYSNAIDNLWKYTTFPFPEDYRPPFFNFVIGYFLNFFSDTFQTGKFLNVIIGTVTAIPLFLIARTYSNEKVAYLVALLYIISPVMISQAFEAEVRMITVYLALTSLYFFLKEKDFNYYSVVFLALLFLTHYAPFETLFITFILFILFTKRTRLFSYKNIMLGFLFLVIISPWVVRNIVLYGSPFFSSSCISLVSDFNECFKLERPTFGSYINYVSSHLPATLFARAINLVRSTFPLPVQGYKDGWIPNFDIFNNHALVYTPISMIVTIPIFALAFLHFFKLIKTKKMFSDIILLYVIIGFVSASLFWSYRTTYTYNFMFPQTVLLMVPGLVAYQSINKKWKKITAFLIIVFLIIQSSVFILKSNASRDFSQSWVSQNTKENDVIMLRWTNVHIMNYFTGRKTMPIPYENEDIVIGFARNHSIDYLIVDQLDFDLGKLKVESLKSKLDLVDVYKIPQPLYDRTYVNTFYIFKV